MNQPQKTFLEKNDKRIDEIINTVVEILKRYFENFTLYLFGSRSKECNLKCSNIDLAIDTNCDKNLLKKVKAEIEEIHTLYSIDIVNMNEVDKEFKKIILKSGKKIYSHEK